ncbi:MAG: hypothetical protein ACE5GJ_04260 [Gemmatimonadota bacterium]
MLIRLDRSRRAGPYLVWKVRFFSVGAVLALGGIYLDDRRIVAGATAVLVVGFLLRFLPPRQDSRERDMEEHDPPARDR